MKKKSKYAKKSKGPDKLVLLLGAAAAALLLLVIVMMLLLPKKNKPAETAATTTAAAVETTAAPGETTVPETTAEATVPQETTREILPYFVEKVEQNPDMVGWIRIPDTKLDYPLMYTPDEPEKYLHLNFNGIFSVGGLPFIEDECSIDPVSDNLLIYGHNMENGSHFRTLMRYDQKPFWEQHPKIYMSTLYEEKEYEIIACLYDRVYLKSENCFKFYQFIDAESEEEFDEAIAYFKDKALYDTGVSAEYGDKLITLVTCSYHVDNGRFLVVAKEVKD